MRHTASARMSAEALYVSGYAAIVHRVERCSCVTRLSPPPPREVTNHKMLG